MDSGCARSAGAWRLSSRAALGLVALLAGLVSLAAGIVVEYAVHESEEVDAAPDEAIAASAVRLAIALTSGAGLAGYIFVGLRAPRPGILHIYGGCIAAGALLNGGMALGEFLDRQGACAAAWLIFSSVYATWGVYRSVFCKVMTDKLAVLGTPATRCQDVHLWGRALTVSAVFTSLAGTLLWVWSALKVLQGIPRDDVLAVLAPLPPDGVKVAVTDKIVIHIMIHSAGIGAWVFFVAAAGYMVISLRLIRTIEAAMACRKTPEEVQAKVRRTLWQHWLGLVLTLSSSMAQIVATMVDGLNLLGEEEMEDLALAAVTFFDTGGDVLGILLLSGIGTLMLREDPDAADINRRIRGLLRAAVLTGRADFAFEGQVFCAENQRCIASFPGKYVQEWKALTWHCERRELSTACVFLPLSDPQRRFGEHCPCPETPGQCWCHSLYGEAKPWGCRWFDAWKANIDRAVKLGLELVVVFFPGQSGQGLIDWEDLPAAELWDGHGLGGSQKGEAAYLCKQGIKFTCEDIDQIRACLACKHTGC